MLADLVLRTGKGEEGGSSLLCGSSHSPARRCDSSPLLFHVSIDLYHFILSPLVTLLGGRCRFYPSCSEYAREAVEIYSLPRAVGLIIWRLLRCGPWHQGGVDFVKSR